MSRFQGAVWDCRADSNTVKQDGEIKIKRIVQRSREDCINCKYSGCGTLPDYFSYVVHWPGQFIFKFKEGEYFFLNNSRPNKPESREVAYDLDYGSLQFNKKKQVLTLNSTKYQVVRVYSYYYSNQDSILTLKLIK